MIKKLEKLLQKSYSPYSKVQVSSILVDKEGKEYPGVNVENASYGATICAERNSILSAITNGKKPGEFSEIHIYSNVGKALFPCCICRQVMTEMFNNETKIFIYGNKQVIEKTLKNLVPDAVTFDSF